MTVKRWTDGMLDKLADKVDVLSDKVDDLTDNMKGLADKVDVLSDKVDDLTDNMKGLKLTTDALLQLAAQSQRKAEQFDEEMELHKQEIESVKKRQAENDERFNVLLEEVRFLIHKQDGNN